MHVPALLALEDGSLFRGQAVGATGETVGEVVFNTAMTGYQEILTDPSYARQIVTLTYPHIGNTGCNAADAESDRVHAAGLIVRDVPRLASNWRSEESLPDYLRRQGIVAIAGIDTRRLTRLLRDQGALAGCIVAGEAAAIDAGEARRWPPRAPSRVSRAWIWPRWSAPASATAGRPAATTSTAPRSRNPRRASMWSPTTSASSTTSCACSPIAAAR